MIGRSFDRLTVFARDINAANGSSKWLCRCICGTITSVRRDQLFSGNTRSCGCFRKEQVSKACVIDLVGKRFGRLIVLSEDGRTRNNNSVVWRCRCDCGKETFVCSNDLRSKSTRSCGCLMRELASKRAIKNIQTFKFGNGISRSCKEFLDVIEVMYSIAIEREYELDNRLFDGRIGRVLIEVDGDFWHRTEFAKRRDEYKDELALRGGYAIVRVVVNHSVDIPIVFTKIRSSFTKVLQLSNII